MKKHSNPFGHVIFEHEYVLEDTSIKEDSIVMTAHLSNFPWLEIDLEFKLDTPRKEVRKALVKELQDKILLLKDFLCAHCDYKDSATQAPYEIKALAQMVKYDYVITEFGKLAEDTEPIKTGRKADNVLFKPYFGFTKTNKEIIKPLFQGWFTERRQN